MVAFLAKDKETGLVRDPETGYLALGLLVVSVLTFAAQETLRLRAGSRLLMVLLVVAGIYGVVQGAKVVVDAAERVMIELGVPARFVGLTIVAFGTSLPELATSVVAALRKEMDISIGNLVGSNVFNLLGVLGVASMLRPIEIPGGFVGSNMYIDALVMLGTSALPLIFMLRQPTVKRWHGAVLLLCYAGFPRVPDPRRPVGRDGGMTDERLDGRVALVTGASRGIGRELARGLAARGARLVIASRTKEDLEETARLTGRPEDVVIVVTDLAVPGAAERLAEKALEAFGHVDLLVNNAGLGYFALLEEATEKSMRRLFEVNTFAPIALARALLPSMKARRHGRIVNVVTAQGRAPVPSVGVYGASKTALAILGNVMRLEIEPAGVVVVNVYPGTVDSEFERHADREAGRLGLSPGGGVGRTVEAAAAEILEVSLGEGGEVWLEAEGRKMAADAILAPQVVDRQLAPLRDHLLHEVRGTKPSETRLWQRWRVAVADPCTLRCGRCPRKGDDPPRPTAHEQMADDTWAALRPYLGEAAEITFLGCKDPLVHPRLFDWIGEARDLGARAGLRTNGATLDDAMAERLLAVHLDRIELTLGGATAKTYASANPPLPFEAFCENVRRLTRRRAGRLPEVTFRFVLMREAKEEIHTVVELADELDVDRILYVHCDVVRELESGRPALFGRSTDPEIRALEKELRRAGRTAKRSGIKTEATSFVPEEQPVCNYDPRRGIFVRHDGVVGPCRNLTVGGGTCFLGRTVVMPTETYGRLADGSLLDLWSSATARRYRDTFRDRASALEERTAVVDLQRSLRRLEETYEAAREAMPDAPEACLTCRFLYNL